MTASGIEPELKADCIRGRPIVPGEQHHRQPEIPQLADRLLVVADDVGDDECSADLAITGATTVRPFDCARSSVRDRGGERRVRDESGPTRDQCVALDEAFIEAGMAAEVVDAGSGPWAAAALAIAVIGCSDADSSTAPTMRSASRVVPSIVTTSTSVITPVVTVPVLSSTTVSRRRVEHLMPMRMPSCASPVPARRAVGVASPSAHWTRDDEDGDRRSESLIGVARDDEPGDQRHGRDQDDGGDEHR